ncbi:hypothetical protein [Corynebacterium halotolerans]|uniref:Uncharacterized protein n=1 Tax=Corynebacterium halotolerans YIM 70093 = DSM 44683 TaxID=1121362 RepID=M1NML7_9CORY|nr:hypothetical protein [Corynebacterium halotolerans]AGF72603.1 hypothetical protein A605_08005 [Corynebacterium halotolerans YIM 70093 = DSM 44683]
MTLTVRARRIVGYALVFLFGGVLGLALWYGMNFLGIAADAVFPWFLGWVVLQFLLIFFATGGAVLLSFRWRGARRVLVWGIWLGFLLGTLFMLWVLIGFARDHPPPGH